MPLGAARAATAGDAHTREMKKKKKKICAQKQQNIYIWNTDKYLT